MGIVVQTVQKGIQGFSRGRDSARLQSRALQLMQGRTPNRDDKWEWYFLMQHYGVPTRLLDWTDNPLIALYFAVNDQPESASDDSAVGVFDPCRLNRQLSKQLDGRIIPCLY